MDTIEMRELLNLSRASFARRYKIPIRTIENWEYGVTKAPAWVLRLLERVVLEDIEIERLEKLARDFDAGKKAGK